MAQFFRESSSFRTIFGSITWLNDMIIYFPKIQWWDARNGGEYTRDRQSFSVKDQIINILGFAGHRVSVSTTQFCHCSMKAAAEDTYMNERSCVPMKCYLLDTEVQTSCNLHITKYSWPSVSVDSTSMDSTNRIKNIREKNSRKFPKAKREFAAQCQQLFT